MLIWPNKFLKLSFSHYSTVFLCIFSTMPEIYINGRSSSHNSSLEIDDFGTSYVTSSGLLVTTESCNSTIANSSPTNTLVSESSFCGIVPLIVFFVLFCAGHYDCYCDLPCQEKTKSNNSRKTLIQTVISNGACISSQCHLIFTNTIILSS